MVLLAEKRGERAASAVDTEGCVVDQLSKSTNAGNALHITDLFLVFFNVPKSDPHRLAYHSS